MQILLGLAYPIMSAHNQLSFFDHLMQEGSLEKDMFSFFLSWNEETPAQLVLGGVDDSKYEGDLVMHPVIDKQFWSIPLVDIWIGDKPLKLCSKEKPCLAAIDSGTSYFTFPPQFMN